MVQDREPETGQHRLTVEVEEPHAWIFMIAGDVFNCLRSALDHAVWRLASLHVGTPTGRPQFPIIEENNADGQREFKKETKELPPSVIPVTEELQPHNRQAGTRLASHPLWCLGKMTNIDKHRYIAIHPTVAFSEWGVPASAVTENDGRRSFVFLWPSPAPPPVPSGAMIEVEFGSKEDGISLPLQDVYEIVKCVNNVLLKLAPFDR